MITCVQDGRTDNPASAAMLDGPGALSSRHDADDESVGGAFGAAPPSVQLPLVSASLPRTVGRSGRSEAGVQHRGEISGRSSIPTVRRSSWLMVPRCGERPRPSNPSSPSTASSQAAAVNLRGVERPMFRCRLSGGGCRRDPVRPDADYPGHELWCS
jgi:hypothetical protein